jgi:hypothetical protein
MVETGSKLDNKEIILTFYKKTINVLRNKEKLRDTGTVLQTSRQ